MHIRLKERFESSRKFWRTNDQYTLNLTHRNPHDSTGNGFVLPTALIASAVILAGCVGLALAGTATRAGAARQYQARLAQDVAEAGIATTIERLNGRYRYLLTKDLSSWSNPNIPVTSICPGAATDFANMPQSGSITNNSGTQIGSYTVSSYTFKGNSYYGGFGTLQVSGEAKSSSGSTLARSVITTNIQVVPKNCGGTITTPPTTSGFPGLMANNINLGNNDVIGQINGNILCLTCSGTTQALLAAEIGQLNNSVVNGTVFGGSIPLPPVPTAPSNLTTTGDSITSTTTYSAGSTNGGKCVIESGITICRIASISLSGSSTMTFVTSAGPMRIYFDGNINFSGSSRMIHTGLANNLIFFGLPADSDPAYRQTVVISGGSTAVNAFIHMPDACVGINGGSSSPDLRGAIWSNRYGGGTGGCGSLSNNGDIQVPDDMGGTLTDTLGDTYNISIRDFAAAGIISWSASTSN